MEDQRDPELPEGDLPISPLPVHSIPDSPPIIRDTIESFAIAIIVALVFKSFLAEAYKVPTGSMEPTIHGDINDGDRILVNKLANALRDPRPWEIWVFQYPNNRRVNYIKRVIGVGPESVWIVNGDIYTAALGGTEDDLLNLHAKGQFNIRRKPFAIADAMMRRHPADQSRRRRLHQPRRRSG